MAKRRKPGPRAPRNPFEPLDGTVAAMLDLHGFRADEAITRVETFLAEAKRRHAGELIHIITGKGRGSAAGPVIKRVVAALLRSDRFPQIDTWGADLEGGGYLIRLRPR